MRGGGGGSGGGSGAGGTTTPAPPATPPSVSLTPSTVSFGAQAVGTTSVAQIVTFTNTGAASQFINGVSILGADQLDFNRADDQCIGSAVAAGASCTITIVFNPTAGTGTSVTGPTPLSVDTTGLSCTSGVCTLGFTVKVTDANGQTATQAFSLTISPQPPPLTKAQQGCQHAPGSTTAALTGPAIAGRTPTGQGVGDQSQLTACGGFTVITASVQNVSSPPAPSSG
jgi:hypothetical protein